MIEDDDFLDEQWQRFSELDGFHRIKGKAIEDFFNVMRVAKTKKILEQVISDIKADATKMILSNQLLRVIRAENDRFDQRESDQYKPAFKEWPDCSKCEDTGWIHVTRMHKPWMTGKYADGSKVEPLEYSGVRSCTCKAAPKEDK